MPLESNESNGPMRILSLVPSISELLVALGLAPRMVGRTGFCIHPAEVMVRLPKVGGTKDVNLDKVRRLAPTHLIVNMDENRKETVDALRDFIPHVLVTHPNAPEDNLQLLAQLTDAFGHCPGVRDKAGVLAQDLQAALGELRSLSWPGQRVLYLIWREPWMTVARDTYIARMLAEVGWQTWPAVAGGEVGAARYPALDGTESWLGDVQRVLLSSEPYAFDEHHIEEAQALCPGAKVQCVDGELLSWYGPRAAQGLRYLRELALDLR
ncbi:MAG: ABC transporter substrate-binding protein [Burkholderiaceae bacterium]|nr:ABC transporter substrate-binding protein [Roseateles sp.]MBV8471684.1 ABC transporter substrate-binding protein [Burkholderiaceae bacterium]